MIRSIIIDDEEDARESLRLTLDNFCPDVRVISICSSGDQGVTAIRKFHPDLVFLDIQMPHMSGFQLLEQMEVVNFKIIFVTAYDQYAIRAIKFNAFDYLVKPVDADELMETIDRMKRQTTDSPEGQYMERVRNIIKNRDTLQKLAVPASERIHLLDLSDIIYFEASGNYTVIHLKGKKRIVASRTLKEFESLLVEDHFCRIHHAAMINLNHVQEYIRGEGGYVLLTEGNHVDVSRRKKEEFLKRISRI